MLLYRACFVTHANQQFGLEYFEAPDDETAIDYAHRNLQSPWGKGHEIWRDGHLIYTDVYH